MNMAIAKEDNRMKPASYKKIVLPLIGGFAVVALMLNYVINTQSQAPLNDGAATSSAKEYQTVTPFISMFVSTLLIKEWSV